MGKFITLPLSKAILLGLLTGVAGLALSPFHFVLNLEENIGLGLLFKLRGVQQAPIDAVVVSIDKESSEKLNLPDNPDKWPRSLHAQLTEALAQEGARVIAFDLHFVEPRSLQDDNQFAEALRKAGDVVLCEPLKLKEVPLSGGRGYDAAAHNIVTVMQPLEIFSRSAVATAPFTLPRIPFKVSQYRTFDTGAGDVPSMPVVALQLFTAEVYGDFVHLLQKVSPDRMGELPSDIKSATETIGIKEVIRTIRKFFENEPRISEKILKELEISDTLSGDLRKKGLIKSLLRMYGGGDSRYINFYGPPGTVTTIPYYQALQSGKSNVAEKKTDFKGKAVFVGLSEVLLAERKDSFYTVFSQANGTFIGGVEIMATAFSNLLAGDPVKRAGTGAFFLIILLGGIFLGVLCRMLPLSLAAAGTAVFCLIYLAAAEYQFKHYHTWYPIVVPLFLQAPVAFVGATVWNYVDTSKELKNVRSAFGHYLPEDVVNQMAKDVSHIKTGSKVIYGICLFTDAQQYTTLSETLEPHELSGLMNRYYETMFKPVKLHGGVISGVTGDSMLALWVAARSEAGLKKKACNAAIDIDRALRQFRQKPADTVKLVTRVGLHCGKIMLGSIGALDHYEYTPMGDIVNTASRMEGLNKYLGTNVLVSSDIIDELDGFLYREAGTFRLKGKAKPIVAYELIGLRETSEEKQIRACDVFAEALSAFREQSWDEAKEKFSQVIEILGKDGLSVFYMNMCERYKENQPVESWGGVIHMEDK